MAINVNALPEYIEVNKDELFVKAVAGTKTLDYIEVMGGVKGKAAGCFGKNNEIQINRLIYLGGNLHLCEFFAGFVYPDTGMLLAAKDLCDLRIQRLVALMEACIAGLICSLRNIVDAIFQHSVGAAGGSHSGVQKLQISCRGIGTGAGVYITLSDNFNIALAGPGALHTG